MIGAPAPGHALRVQHGVGRLRAAEVHAQSLAERLGQRARGRRRQTAAADGRAA